MNPQILEAGALYAVAASALLAAAIVADCVAAPADERLRHAKVWAAWGVPVVLWVEAAMFLIPAAFAPDVRDLPGAVVGSVALFALPVVPAAVLSVRDSLVAKAHGCPTGGWYRHLALFWGQFFAVWSCAAVFVLEHVVYG